MATYIERFNEGKHQSLLAETQTFHRGKKLFGLKKKRSQRTLNFLQVTLLLFLQVSFFLGLKEIYLFVIQWDELNVRTVEVSCPLAFLQNHLETSLAKSKLGNILLVDPEKIRRELQKTNWVKDVSIQKIFPSTLKIEVLPRTPYVLALVGSRIILADEEGVNLGFVASREEFDLPLISDEQNFSENFSKKWLAVRKLLLEIPASERNRLAEVLCSDHGRFTLLFKDAQTRIIVSWENPAEDLAFYRAHEVDWQAELGPFEYIDLSCDGRVFVKPLEMTALDAPGQRRKETE